MEELELEQNEQLLEQRRLRRLEQKRRRKMQQRMVLGLLALIVVLALVLIVRGCRAKPAPTPVESSVPEEPVTTPTEPEADSVVQLTAVGDIMIYDDILAAAQKSEGVYDFSWIDSIVDNLIARGMEPWIDLCYGNELYTEMAKTVFGAVGCPPIFSEREKKAWHDYVAALVTHFRGRVKWYEIWNEPDGRHCWKHGVNATETALFNIDTAKVIKEADPEAKAIGGTLCGNVLLKLLSCLDPVLKGLLVC